jgi:hypothetical protein
MARNTTTTTTTTTTTNNNNNNNNKETRAGTKTTIAESVTCKAKSVFTHYIVKDYLFVAYLTMLVVALTI